jgi:hypothetical protein
LRIHVAHDLDDAREVTMFDALGRFERRKATRFERDTDDATSAALGRKPATRPLAGT